jgi:TonB family protein
MNIWPPLLTALVVCTTFLGLPSIGFAQSEMVEALPGVKPLTVVAPAFPKNKTAPAAGVEVFVAGVVLANGQFKPESITSIDPERAYIDAVTEALAWWRFTPAVDTAQCAPRDSQTKFSIQFEGSHAEPRVYVSFLHKPEVYQPAEKTALKVESLFTRKINFPERLMDMEGEVNVLFLISPDGELKSAKVRSSTPYGAFDALVLESARRARVTWRSPKPDKDVCMSRSYLFCVSGHVSLPFAGCK